MTIQKLTESTEIKPGQWVCTESNLRDGICGRQRKVVKASGARIYVTETSGEDFGHFISRKSVLFVCDTREEADALYAINEAHYREVNASKAAIMAASMAKIDALMTGSVPQ